ncbi:MAG: 2-amino-4-hydroxy-6-hydroxymethyldihydropteridine diphosphokinase [Burkholderiaceae bacterium]|nr:2-amino-4-hydroxy-6-hydroxymethyldihydropteridine diphosphokinase [Burkholderiaceae bacterium]
MPLDPPVRAFVAVGSNLGERVATVRRALQALGELPQTRLLARSGLYRAAPREAARGDDFINAVAALETRLTAERLLDALLALERQAGRQRPYHHAPRTLDLDLLLHGQARLDSPRLTLPHPRMAQRAFVLVPLAEIAPQCVTAQALAAVAGQAIERVAD